MLSAYYVPVTVLNLHNNHNNQHTLLGQVGIIFTPDFGQGKRVIENLSYLSDQAHIASEGTRHFAVSRHQGGFQ